jgi:hypothetical protein
MAVITSSGRVCKFDPKSLRPGDTVRNIIVTAYGSQVVRWDSSVVGMYLFTFSDFGRTCKGHFLVRRAGQHDPSLPLRIRISCKPPADTPSPLHICLMVGGIQAKLLDRHSRSVVYYSIYLLAAISWARDVLSHSQGCSSPFSSIWHQYDSRARPPPGTG